MGYAILAIVALVVGYMFYSKIKQALYVAKDRSLVKEDLALVKKENDLKVEIKELKADVEKPTIKLTPEQVETYWSNKK